MKANETALLSFLKKSSQLTIPIYQRSYAWTETECLQLLNDILDAGIERKDKIHFVGSVMYIEDGLSQVSYQAPLMIIDGQQRLTTITLLLSALIRVLGDREIIDGFSASKIKYYYLVNREEEGEKRYKLILSKKDKESLISIIDDTDHNHEKSIRIYENFEFFHRKIINLDNKQKLDTLCNGLRRLGMIDIALNSNTDNPQLIFESMNSTGLALGQADLVRNYVLMGVNQKTQKKLYSQYWLQMEKLFGQTGYSKYFDNYMRHFLTVKLGHPPRVNDVYNSFKKFVNKDYQPDIDKAQHTEKVLQELKVYSKYYCAIALGIEEDKEIAKILNDLRELKVETAFPFILSIYYDYDNGVISKKEFCEILLLIESYIFRLPFPLYFLYIMTMIMV